MGINRAWRRAAEAAGFEAFVAVWRVLASDPSVLDDRNRICVPAFDTWLRFQRNQVIRELTAQGWSRTMINAKLVEQGCEPINEVHMKRIQKRFKVEP